MSDSDRTVAQAVFQTAFYGATLVAVVVGLASVKGLVSSREERRSQAADELSRQFGGPQWVTGPVLVASYQGTVEKLSGGVLQWVPRRGKVLVFAEHLAHRSSAQLAERSRGIFSIPVFDSTQTFEVNFEWPKELEAELTASERWAEFHWSGLEIRQYIQDPQGVREASLEVAGKAVPWESNASGWLTASLSESPGTGPVAARSTLRLRGTQSQSWTPLARQFHAQSSADWPHPSFSGAMLPDRREVTQAGFSAEWLGNPQRGGRPRSQPWPADEEGQRQWLAQEEAKAFGVRWFDPLDVYALSERATKYGFLLVLSVGLVFVIFAVRQRISLHPIQTALVAASMVVFFLLLLALAEHLGFAFAYALAAAACALINGVYTGAIVQSRWAGGLFSSHVSVVLGALYLILLSEDYALLLGSLFVLGLLVLLMAVTRRQHRPALPPRLGSRAPAEAPV